MVHHGHLHLVHVPHAVSRQMRIAQSGLVLYMNSLYMAFFVISFQSQFALLIHAGFVDRGNQPRLCTVCTVCSVQQQLRHP